MVAQSPDWESEAGGRAEFVSASIMKHTDPVRIRPGPVIPLGLGDVYTPSGGRFVAVNRTLVDLVVFAYKVTNGQGHFLLPQLSGWAITDRFDIEATTQGNPTKDQMRLMMQALLAERFRLAIHYETRQVPAYVDHGYGKVRPSSSRARREFAMHNNDLCSESSTKRAPTDQRYSVSSRVRRPSAHECKSSGACACRRAECNYRVVCGFDGWNFGRRGSSRN